MKTKAYRQGDVVLKPVSKLPSGLKLKDNILAYGESTGHKHQFRGDKVKTYTDGQKQYCVLEEEAILDHEEHHKQTLPKGVYEVEIQREVDLVGVARQVMD